MVNGTTRLIQNAAPSEAVVYAQALNEFKQHLFAMTNKFVSNRLAVIAGDITKTARESGLQNLRIAFKNKS
jgi:hypothetical protein